MNSLKATFRRVWITAGQSDLWNCNSSYCAVPYDDLPKVDGATDDLAWLDRVSPGLRQTVDGTCTLDSEENQIAHLDDIVAKARGLGLSLPEPFQRFMRDADLQQKVPTCTACFLELSRDFIPIQEAEGHFLLRFLNDSQSCVMWYLCIGPEESNAVIASYYFFERDYFDAMEYEDIKHEELVSQAFFCAATFTEFLYRFWVENTLWYSLRDGLELTAIQEQYRSQISRKL